MIAARAALEKRAEDVLVMDLRRLSSVCDFFVIATAATYRQIVAMTEHVEATLRRAGHRVWHTEGLTPWSPPGKPGAPFRRPSTSLGTTPRHMAGDIPSEGPPAMAGARVEGSQASANGFSWVLMDCGEFVVHLFDPPARAFYQLERLWGDAPRLPLGAS